MSYKIILHQASLGVTERALIALRNELSRRVDNEISVIQVPSGVPDDEGYGFFIFDKTRNEVAIIGDGFRSDGGGEGGSGARSAQALLRIFGIHPIEAEPMESVIYSDDASLYEDVVVMLGDVAGANGFKMPATLRPEKIDWLFARKVS